MGILYRKFHAPRRKRLVQVLTREGPRLSGARSSTVLWQTTLQEMMEPRHGCVNDDWCHTMTRITQLYITLAFHLNLNFISGHLEDRLGKHWTPFFLFPVWLYQIHVHSLLCTLYWSLDLTTEGKLILSGRPGPRLCTSAISCCETFDQALF